MKRADFNRFYEAVMTAEEKDPIWWAGYLWINLTEKQCDNITEALTCNKYVKVSEDGYKLPSGILLKRTDK